MPKNISMSPFEAKFEKAMAAAAMSDAPTKKALKGLGSGTVRNFLLVLTSKITQLDQRNQNSARKRGQHFSIYGLGIMLKAAADTRDAVTDHGVDLDASDEASLRFLKRAMNTYFNDNFPPLKNVEKQIQAWLTAGKPPSLLG